MNGRMVWSAVALASMALYVGTVITESAYAEGQVLVLEDFQGKEADGFPSSWDHENQRSHSKGREA